MESWYDKLPHSTHCRDFLFKTIFISLQIFFYSLVVRSKSQKKLFPGWIIQGCPIYQPEGVPSPPPLKKFRPLCSRVADPLESGYFVRIRSLQKKLSSVSGFVLKTRIQDFYIWSGSDSGFSGWSDQDLFFSGYSDQDLGFLDNRIRIWFLVMQLDPVKSDRILNAFVIHFSKWYLCKMVTHKYERI